LLIRGGQLHSQLAGDRFQFGNALLIAFDWSRICEDFDSLTPLDDLLSSVSDDGIAGSGSLAH
jgi:hypothetical protein